MLIGEARSAVFPSQEVDFRVTPGDGDCICPDLSILHLDTQQIPQPDLRDVVGDVLVVLEVSVWWVE